jgi:disulfide bond formation protein DsbB
VGTAGSLYLSLGLGLKACPLCFYQRSFMMGTFAVLALGLAVDRRQPRLYCLLSLPLALAGGGVALFHEYLVVTGVLECPRGFLGLGTSPAQSLAIFTLTVTVVVAGVLARGSDPSSRAVSISGAAMLGLLLAWASIAGSPPLPPAPKAPYDPVKQPLDMCRPRYHLGNQAGGTERH